METAPEGLARPTLATVAAAAGVSQATVSKVLNDRADVSATTRRRVEELLREYKYSRPGAAGRTGGVVELVIDGLDSPWAVEILRGVERECHEHGIGVVVSRWRPDAHGRSGWASEASKHGSHGVVLVKARVTAAERALLRAARAPVVVIDPVDVGDVDVPSVGATNWNGGLAATEHLVGLDHVRIAAIGGPPELMCTRARIDGYHAALDRAGSGTGWRTEFVRYGDFSFAGGFREARELLALNEPPTAVFAGSDQQALGVYEAARQAQLRIPDDLSVVGFDDIPLCEWVSPPLTTVRQPLEQMGQVATDTLLQVMAGRHLVSPRVELSTELKVRLSTAPPAAR